MTDITAEQIGALIEQNAQMLQLLVTKELGNTGGMNQKQYQNQVVKMLEGMKFKAPDTGHGAQFMHGPTGVFSTYGLDREIISTHVEPRGILSVLKMFPNNDTDPRFGALTGFSDDIGDNPQYVCADAPTGYIKACNLTAQYGLVTKMTETIDALATSLRLNRGDFTDLQLMGLDIQTDHNGMPQIPNLTSLVNNLVIAEMAGVGVRMHRHNAKTVWQGDPANNNAGGGYKEGPGLDVQIATAQVDADTGTACPSLDSDVKNFAYDNVNGSGSRDIVEYISMLEYFIWTLAEDTRMAPCEWIFAMRPQLWYELTRVWPILYSTDQVAIALAAATNARVMLNGRENIDERDKMRTMGQIAVNGRSYRVVEDTGIFEKNSTNDAANLDPGEYASSIYFVPLTARGNFNVTYMNHIDYRMALGMIPIPGLKDNFWTDRGVYSWTAETIKWCFDLTARTEQRVVLRTPQLAGRIDNVKYTPLQHLREFDPDSPHHVNGGVSLRAAPTKNAVWL